MTDFRDEVYRRYVSSFKGTEQSTLRGDLARRGRSRAALYEPLMAVMPANGRVLDVGCGSGDTLDFLAEAGFQAVGVDASAEQIELARRRGLDAVVGDVFAYLKTQRAVYDGIVALDFVEHFSKEELLALLRVLRAALAPTGVLMIRTPNGGGLFGGQVIFGDYSHLTILNPGSLKQVLLLSGFQEIAFYETAPTAVSVGTAARRGAWKAIRQAARVSKFVESGKWQDIWTENMVCVCRNSGAPADGSAP